MLILKVRVVVNRKLTFIYVLRFEGSFLEHFEGWDFSQALHFISMFYFHWLTI